MRRLNNDKYNNVNVVCLIPIVYYLLNIRKFKLDTKTMIVIALFAACGLILSKIKLIQYPQGGGIDLLSSLPILMIGSILWSDYRNDLWINYRNIMFNWFTIHNSSSPTFARLYTTKYVTWC